MIIRAEIFDMGSNIVRAKCRIDEEKNKGRKIDQMLLYFSGTGEVW